MASFDDIISYESLYRAHRQARLGKRYKKEVVAFELNLSRNLWKLHYELKYGTYRVGEYRRFKIYDPKEREIQAIPYRDRVVQHSICDGYLSPLLDKMLIGNNVACRKGKGSSAAVHALKKFMTEHYKKYKTAGYFVKIDVHKYFDSIDHMVLKGKLQRIVKDEKIFQLLCQIIASYEHIKGQGLPLGNQTSQHFALLYLDYLDKYITCTLGVKHYVRYMDDIIILVPFKASARETLVRIRDILTRERLVLNSKSQIIAAKNGVCFLGWRFCFGADGKIKLKILPKSKQRILSHYGGVLKYEYKKKTQVLASYRGYLKKGETYSFYRSLCLQK